MAARHFDLAFCAADGDAELPPTARLELAQFLSGVLGTGNMMLKGWTYYGTESSCRPDVVGQPGEKCNVSARLDARSADTDEFIGIVCLAATIL